MGEGLAGDTDLWKLNSQIPGHGDGASLLLLLPCTGLATGMGMSFHKRARVPSGAATATDGFSTGSFPASRLNSGKLQG